MMARTYTQPVRAIISVSAATFLMQTSPIATRIRRMAWPETRATDCLVARVTS